MTEHWRKLQVGDCCELLGILKEEYDMQHAEIERLRARITELEAIVTVGHGTMGTLQPDEPPIIIHGHTPNAPPHDE